MAARPRGVAAKSRKAALLYMAGDITVREAAERFGISGASVHQQLIRMRAAERNSWPEDEVTW